MSLARATDLRHALDEGAFGGKAVQLGAAIRAGLPVPPGVALPWDAVEALARESRGESGEREHAEALLARHGGRVAVRSSAVGEDSSVASFAGVHRTLLNVREARALVDAIAAVHESAGAVGALAYRLARGQDATPRMGVVVQRLVRPDVAGVLFTRHPVTRADERVVEATWGLGEALVSGIVTPDHYRVARTGAVLERRLGEKDVALAEDDAGGTVEVEIDAGRAAGPCLGDADLAQVLDLAARCEALNGGAPLDLEWCLADGRAWLLQQRPMTA